MADDNTIIEGTVKFRDGKKWKSRWCVMRKLSPVADCVQLQVWRDARARWGGGGGGGGCKAALSLQKYLGTEAGFTLDKHSHTLALLCQDLVAVLAFDSRERLIQWQVKVQAHLGEGRSYLVVAGGGAGRRGLPAGPARLHLRDGHVALAAGVPPKLLGVWEIQHLRRYGVMDGRFCFEGGSLCGRGEGLHVLVTDAARDIARDFQLAAQGRLAPRMRANTRTKDGGSAESPRSQKDFRSDTRLSHQMPGEEPSTPGDLGGAESAGWAAAERGDAVSVVEGAWGGRVSLERCVSCMSKLGALSRSSTAALTPGAAPFSPAWTMEAVAEPPPERPPRPPKPTTLSLHPRPLPAACSCGPVLYPEDNSKIGPYENYDVPRIPSSDIEGEYYDTPKRLKECMESELFKMTKSSTSSAVILKKSCGCLLKFGRRRKPTVVDVEENFPKTNCACQRVTAWAHNWIRFPSCGRDGKVPVDAPEGSDVSVPNKENVIPNGEDRSALYATIDLSRKVRWRTAAGERGPGPRAVEIDDGPLANYENLSFALSLEHYENAKDLLRRVGVTQAELDAISASLRPSPEAASCTRCGHRRDAGAGDYLVMNPSARAAEDGSAPGYTPMSPGGGLGVQTLRARSPARHPLEEKSASNPALADSDPAPAVRPRDHADRRKRSSSADSARFLDAPEAAESARGSASSLETLRGGVTAPDAETTRRTGGAARDSSSSADSGVSSWSLREPRFELPATTGRRLRWWRRGAGAGAPTAARRSRSVGAVVASGAVGAVGHVAPKSSSAEAEVPVLSVRLLRGGGVADAHSTSSGASDMSDYIETLSLCSSHSSTDTPDTMRMVRQTSTLRPRSGKEYHNIDPRLASVFRRPPQPHPPPLYTNLP